MSRKEDLKAFIEQHDNINFNSTNIPKILANLELADKNNCLREFLLNKKPYISNFTFFVFNGKNQAARGKDQVAIVFALNLYGAKTPGFAERLNRILKEFATGSSKQMMSVAVLMKAQMELQVLNISLINFVDAELLTILNEKIKKEKPVRLTLMILLLFAGAIGMPGLSIAGFPPLSLVAMVAFVYAFIKIAFWLGIKQYPAEFIESATQTIGDCAD